MRALLFITICMIIYDGWMKKQTMGDRIMEECFSCLLYDVQHLSPNYHVWTFEDTCGLTHEYITTEPYLLITKQGLWTSH